MYVPITFNYNTINVETDVSGTEVLYETLCDNNNTVLLTQEDKIITNRNLIRGGGMLQLASLRSGNNKISEADEFDSDEREFDRDFDRYSPLNEVMSEESGNMNKLPINSCGSWNLSKEIADPNVIISMVIEAFNRLDVTNARTIVALVTRTKFQYESAEIWEVSINEGQTYVNKLSSAILKMTRPNVRQ